MDAVFKSSHEADFVAIAQNAKAVVRTARERGNRADAVPLTGSCCIPCPSALRRVCRRFAVGAGLTKKLRSLGSFAATCRLRVPWRLVRAPFDNLWGERGMGWREWCCSDRASGVVT